MINSNQAFNLALGLGFVQIIFGLVIQAVNKIMQFGYKYAVTPLAWIILLLSIADLTLTRQTGIVAQYGAYLSIAAILFYNDPDAALPARIGKGIWQLYGITGFIGDLLSYIRLFALGISSAILGLVINDLAGRMNDIPYIGWALFIVFLVVGHGANLLIASLGAFVHPLRLTFVEFYKNAGFTGGGKAYKPFGKKQVSET
jgi:V/A-type H+-transporting ATPase subunit I